jgi:leucyl-tRNA synthetase
MPVQINGKLRGTVEVSRGLDDESVKRAVLENAKLSEWIAGKEPRKWIILEDKLVNVVL